MVFLIFLTITWSKGQNFNNFFLSMLTLVKDVKSYIGLFTADRLALYTTMACQVLSSPDMFVLNTLKYYYP